MTAEDTQPAAGETGRKNARREEEEPLGTMEDVSHTPDEGTSADRVWDGTRVRPADDDE